MVSRQVQAILKPLRNTILHPQWLLNSSTDFSKLIAENVFGTVLDIGCADRWAENHIPKNSSYIGLDYPTTGLNLYASKPTVFANASSLPFANQSVDSVIMFEVLEHIASPQNALMEAQRVLKPGGILLFSMPFLYPIHDEPHDYQRLTSYGLQRDLEAAGLECQKTSASLHSLTSTGLLINLSFSGCMLQAAHSKHLSLLLAPLLVISIPLINGLFWLSAKILPHWEPLTAGYYLIAKKKKTGAKEQSHAE